MLRQIWQWLKGLFQGLFGRKGKSQRLDRRRERATSPQPLTDTDYEFLFSELLEGVAHGWHQGRIVKFFEQLEGRGKQEQWVAWLQRFGGKVLASPAPNHQLAARMVQLGQLVVSWHSLSQLGEVSYAIGSQLLHRDSPGDVWEYGGSDLPQEQPQEGQPASISEPPSTEAVPMEALSLDQLLAMLEQDGNLVEKIAQDLDLESNDPQELVQALLDRLNLLKAEADSHRIGEPAAAWFNLGIEQANAGDLASAIASWEKALELEPNLSPAWHNRGTALGELGQLEEAIASFDRAIATKPDDCQAWNERGNTLYKLQRWEEAIASWDRAIELQVNHYQAWYNRGCALENLGRLQEAIASYEKALELQPDFEPAQSRRTHLLENLDETNQS